MSLYIIIQTLWINVRGMFCAELERNLSQGIKSSTHFAAIAQRLVRRDMLRIEFYSALEHASRFLQQHAYDGIVQ